MKLKWWRRFSSDVDLKAFGGTPLRPADLSLVNSFIGKNELYPQGGVVKLLRDLP